MIEDILKDKNDLEKRIKECDDKMEILENIIKNMENALVEQDNAIKEIVKS